MPMGIVSDKDFENEDSKLNPQPKPKSEVITIEKGRGNNPEVPNGLRNIIGETAITDGRASALDLAKQFGLSPSSVSAYTQGATSTATYDVRPNEGVIRNTKEKIGKIARGKLMKALRNITDDKLESTSARDLSGIAKDMSAVVRNMEEEQSVKNNTVNTGPTFVIYSPQFKKEEHFDVVTAKE